MNRNMLYLIIGALIAAVVALGLYVYQQQSKREGVEIKLNDSGISIQQN